MSKNICRSPATNRSEKPNGNQLAAIPHTPRPPTKPAQSHRENEARNRNDESTHLAQEFSSNPAPQPAIPREGEIETAAPQINTCSRTIEEKKKKKKQKKRRKKTRASSLLDLPSQSQQQMPQILSASSGGGLQTPRGNGRKEGGQRGYGRRLVEDGACDRISRSR